MAEINNPGISAADVAAMIAAAVPGTNVLKNSPYTVQDAGANPLASVVTTGLPAGSIVGVSDLGGCGAAGTPGFGFAIWTGAEWRRVSRGVQVTYAPVATINLDYWKDPMRIIVSGTTVLSNARILIANGKNGALYSMAKPGLATNLLSAFGVGSSGSPAGSDIAVVGPSTNYFEIINSTITQVQTT